ncbi:hypothetical protein [Streptomyces sp. NPDC058739]|uniref:hypothetical protein n=1 Tax=Streptomyces sp. NPDC058739 TaxID=3346618 RepID=UPI003698F625
MTATPHKGVLLILRASGNLLATDPTTRGREAMSEYQDHVRHSLEGQDVDPREDVSIDAMRWTPHTVSEDVTDEATQAAFERAHVLVDRATDAYLSLVNVVLGAGQHHMVASASAPHGDLVAGQDLTVIDDALIVSETESLRVCAVIAAGMSGRATGGLVVRTFGLDGAEFVRGWIVRGLWLRPLTPQEIREAYSVNPETGEPVAPEPGVEYRQAEQVPRPDRGPTPPESASLAAPRDNRPPNRRN